MSLLDDCIKVLGQNAAIISKQETDDLFHELTQQFSFTRWGRIDWTTVAQKQVIETVSKIMPFLLESGKGTSQPVFILWDEMKLPAIESSMDAIPGHLEEVTIVSFDTWLFCPTDKYVIEFYHEGDITIGLSD